MRKNRLVIWLLVMVTLSWAAPALAQGREPQIALPGVPLTPATAPKTLPGSGGIEIETVGQLGGAVTAVDVQGNRAYLGVGPRLVILDVSDPAHPVMLGQSALFNGPTAHVSQVLAVGTQAYVVADECLYQVDVSNPAAPVIVGPVPYPPHLQPIPHPRPAEPDMYSMRIATGGSRLCVIFAYNHDWYGSYTEYYVALYDISESETPTLLASLEDGNGWSPLPNPDTSAGDFRFSDVYMGEKLVWVSDGCYGMQSDTGSLIAYDVTNESATRAGTRIGAGRASQLVGSGHYLYALEQADLPYYAEASLLRAFDITAPMTPTLVASCPISGCVDAALAPGGDLIYAAAEDALDILDVSDPLNPHLASHLDLPATAICVVGNLAYVASGSALAVLDISTPAQPTPVGQWSWAGAVERMAIAGSKAYLSDGSATLRIADISDPARPTIVGTYVCSAPIVDLGAEGQYVYLATSAAVTVLDTLDPTQPVLVHVAQGFAEGALRQVRVAVEWLYALSEGPVLTMFHVYDPASPDWQPEGQLRIPSLESLDQVSCDYAYISRRYEEGDWYFTDVTPIPLHGGTVAAPLTLRADSVLIEADATGSLVLFDEYYSGGCFSEWSTSIYDMTDVTHPLCVRTIYGTNIGYSTEAYFSGRTASISGGFALVYGASYGGGCHSYYSPSQLRLVDVSDPARSLVVGEYDSEEPVQAQVVGDLLLEAVGEAGLAIRRLVRLPVCSLQGEVEDFPYPGRVAVGRDESASSCGYVFGSEPDSWGSYGSTESDLFNLPHAGEYILWVRGMGLSWDENLLTIYTEYSQADTYQMEFTPVDGVWTWTWQRVSDPLRFTESNQWLVFVSREPNVRLDSFVLTDDPYYVPSAITPCGGILALPLVRK